MKIPLSPMFAKALAIDLILIFISYSITIFLSTGSGISIYILENFILVMIIIYAILHTILEAIGIG